MNDYIEGFGLILVTGFIILGVTVSVLNVFDMEVYSDSELQQDDRVGVISDFSVSSGGFGSISTCTVAFEEGDKQVFEGDMVCSELQTGKAVYCNEDASEVCRVAPKDLEVMK